MSLVAVQVDLQVLERLRGRLLPQRHHQTLFAVGAAALLQVLNLVEALAGRTVSLGNWHREGFRTLRFRCLIQHGFRAPRRCDARLLGLGIVPDLVELQGEVFALGAVAIGGLLKRSGGSAVLQVDLVFFVLVGPVQQEVGGHLSQQAVDQPHDLSAGDHLGADEVAVQVEDKVDDLRRAHALLDVAGEGHLIDADLVGQRRQLVLQAQLGWLVLDAEVHRNNHGTGR